LRDWYALAAKVATAGRVVLDLIGRAVSRTVARCRVAFRNAAGRVAVL